MLPHNGQNNKNNLEVVRQNSSSNDSLELKFANGEVGNRADRKYRWKRVIKEIFAKTTQAQLPSHEDRPVAKGCVPNTQPFHE
ncbi:MAG: hypothetical protein DYG96_02285 [Chlorobi bacterium CHB2]|nr:hypothetical protein [Chlorobi bacterium CHB2]